MRILCVSGYPAWKKVSKYEMPSHHLYGIHEMIEHYEEHNHSIRGILKSNVLDGGYADFYLWRSGKKNAIKQTFELLKLSKQYDVVYDMLNRCSFFLGIFRKCHIMKTKIVTIMHHPSYKMQLKVADSDIYIFFDEEYKKLAERDNEKKKDRYYVNEWRPDIKWYTSIPKDKEESSDCFFIDNGKSLRDRQTLIEAAERAQIRVDYAGDIDGEDGWARSYKVDLKDDIAQLKKLKKYKAIIIPIQKSKKEKIGPLGITSYLDAISLGIPVIVSDNACFSDEIRRLDIGMVYKTGNAEELATMLRNVESDKELYTKYQQNIARSSFADILKYSMILRQILKSL